MNDWLNDQIQIQNIQVAFGASIWIDNPEWKDVKHFQLQEVLYLPWSWQITKSRTGRCEGPLDYLKKVYPRSKWPLNKYRNFPYDFLSYEFFITPLGWILGDQRKLFWIHRASIKENIPF